MAKIDFGDGQVVELSKETTKRLREELLKPTPPRDFEDGDFSIAVSGGYARHVEIDTNTGYGGCTRVCRNLAGLKEIRNQLNVFIDYLKEIENE